MVDENFISLLLIVSLFLDNISDHTLSAYIDMELSVENHQYWLLAGTVMVIIFLQLLNTLLMNGNLLETFKIQEQAIAQLQMKIEFMSSVATEHCKSFYIKSTLFWLIQPIIAYW